MDSSTFWNLTITDHSEELIGAKTSIVEARYAMTAMLFLQVYELIAGMEEEVRLIHRARWTFIKSLYLLCRYYPLALWVIVMWAYVGDHSFQMCNRIVHPVHAVLAPCQFFSQAVMVMRAFAFSGRNFRILLLLGFCYISLLGVDIWVFCTRVDTAPEELFWILGGTGCFPNYGAGFMALRIGYTMLAATLMDLLSLAVVCTHCLKSRNRDTSLARYFVNQGLVAFAFVSIVNIAAAIAFFHPPSYHTGIGLPLILVVSNLMACRIILQLREKVTPTSSELARQNSAVVRNALMTRPEDSWVIDGEP